MRGRCINVIDGIVGGIGWRGCDEVLEWSADGPAGRGVQMPSYGGITSDDRPNVAFSWPR